MLLRDHLGSMDMVKLGRMDCDHQSKSWFCQIELRQLEIGSLLGSCRNQIRYAAGLFIELANCESRFGVQMHGAGTGAKGRVVISWLSKEPVASPWARSPQPKAAAMCVAWARPTEPSKKC